MVVTSAHPFRILVVDDEPDLEPLVLQRMRRSIRGGEYTFVFAHNGIEALEVLGKDPTIDMVLSDINMPRMDGLTLLEQIPQVSPDIRCVIVSAYGDMKNIRVAMNRGAFDFVTKPIDFEDLKVTIDRTMRHLQEWREALASRDKLVVLQNELDVASKMQKSILPTTFPTSPDYKVSARMQAARNVGGDFYDVMNPRTRRARARDRRCLRQGRSRRALHDVLPHAPQGRRDRHGQSRPGAERGQRICFRRATTPRCS